MDTELQPRQPKAMTWSGRILSGLIVVFMCFMATMGLMRPASMQQQMKEGSAKIGWPEEQGPTLCVVEIACVVLYAIPQTSVLGAILLAGYLGGATAAHVRVYDKAAVMPITFAILIWLGIYLREPRLRKIVFWR